MARPSKPHQHKGYWRVRIDGEEIHLGKDKRAALREFHRLMAQRNAADVGDRPVTVNGLIAFWKTVNDASCYSRWLTPFQEWGGETFIGEIERDTLTRFFLYLKEQEAKRAVYDRATKTWTARPTGQPLSARTIRGYMKGAAAVLRWAIEQGWTAIMPVMPKLPTPIRKDRSLADGALSSAFDAMLKRAKRAAWILRFIRATGCRPSEACRLEWSHIDAARGIAVLPEHKTAKATGKPRSIYLTPDALDVLKSVQEARSLSIVPLAGYVFRNRKGQPYTPRGLRSIMRRYADGATPYQLRHSFAQSGSDAGLQQDVLAALLGHSSTRTTEGYYQVRDERAAAAAKGLTLKRTSVA